MASASRATGADLVSSRQVAARVASAGTPALIGGDSGTRSKVDSASECSDAPRLMGSHFRRLPVPMGVPVQVRDRLKYGGFQTLGTRSGHPRPRRGLPFRGIDRRRPPTGGPIRRPVRGTITGSPLRSMTRLSAGGFEQADRPGTEAREGRMPGSGCGCGCGWSSRCAKSRKTNEGHGMGIRKCRTYLVIAVTGALLSVACGAGRAHAAGDPVGPRCVASQLAVSQHAGEGGLGNFGAVVVFTDRGGPCTMHGYPGLVALRGGRVIVRAHETRNGYLGGLRDGTPAPVVHLRTGRSASALYDGRSTPPGGTPSQCPQYTALLVTAPGTGRAFRLPRGSSALALCDLQIHPVVPGTGGAEGGVL
jgi:hypothetical protein